MKRHYLSTICPFNPLKVTVVYIYVRGSREYLDLAAKFVGSYSRNPPGYPHDTLIVCNNGRPTKEEEEVFKPLPNVRFLLHDNTGKDIGGFIAASHQLSERNVDLMVCFGSHGYLWREDWLARMVEAPLMYGPGLYGSSASYEVLPHLNTVGFWVHPKLLDAYPWKVVTDDDRYNFENRRTRDNRQFWKMVYRMGYPVLLVTWDGEYEWWDWRKPANIFRRGDQTNMLAWWKQTDVFRDSSPQGKAQFIDDTDVLRDRRFNLKQRTFV